MCACIYKYNTRGLLPLGGFAPQTPTPSRPSASGYWLLQNWPSLLQNWPSTLTFLKNIEYLKKVAEFAEEVAEFTPGIRRARALGPGPWARLLDFALTNLQKSYEFTKIL